MSRKTAIGQRALEHFGNILTAPDFLAVELANIAWKKARLKQIDPQHAAPIAAPEAPSQVALLPSLSPDD